MIKVLIVDNSLFMRQLVSEMCGQDPDISVVGTAKSGAEALDLLPKLCPDVITLDIAMPGMNGLETLKKIMAVRPTKVVILSAYSREGAAITLDCLEAGAVSFVLKPSGEMSLDIAKVKEKLLSEIHAAAGAQLSLLAKPGARRKKGVARVEKHGSRCVVVIGASTGGPQVLETVCSSLPAAFPAPVVVVLHMPSQTFTGIMAKRLNDNCELSVKEAEADEVVKPGHIYLAPGGYHTAVEAKGHNAHASRFMLKPSEPGGLSPSIDILMSSAADIYRENAIGVILTGMGADGALGMHRIKKAGGRTIVQDEESSLIFGMPKVVIDNGDADMVVPALEIAPSLVKLVERTL